MLGLTKLYPEQENALFHFLSRKNVFVQIFRRAILLQVNSRNRVHSLKHTASLLLFLPWLRQWMTKWDVEILFRAESHVFAKAAKSLKVSEGKLSWIAADTFLRIFLAIPGTVRYY